MTKKKKAAKKVAKKKALKKTRPVATKKKSPKRKPPVTRKSAKKKPAKKKKAVKQAAAPVKQPRTVCVNGSTFVIPEPDDEHPELTEEQKEAARAAALESVNNLQGRPTIEEVTVLGHRTVVPPEYQDNSEEYPTEYPGEFRTLPIVPQHLSRKFVGGLFAG